MGTNYYAHINACNECNRSNNIVHIGKSSMGWTFSFHAVDLWEAEDAGLSNPIRSWKDWRDVLSCDDVKIRDEYDGIITFHEFSEMVERKKSEKNNHTTYCKNDPMIGEIYKEGQVFLDKEGNSFSKGEFS